MILDLMTLLKEEYDKYVQELNDKRDEKDRPWPILPSLDGFIEFSRDYLARINPPVNLAYMPVGVGLRLQQGHTVGFTVQKVEEYQMRDEGVPVTRPMSIPGMHGITSTYGIPIGGN